MWYVGDGILGSSTDVLKMRMKEAVISTSSSCLLAVLPLGPQLCCETSPEPAAPKQS